MKQLVTGYSTFRSFFFLLLISCFVSTSAQAADKYVRAGATGAANGSDWANAYTTLPTTLTRGDTYYVASGTYSGTYTFNTPTSGTTLITIKKATVADHGTATGWSDTFGDGVATFTGQLNFTTSYWLFDGQVGGGPGNWTSGHGFKVSVTSASPALRTGAVSNVTIRHIEVQGNNNSSGGGSIAQDGLASYGGTNLTLSYYYIHDMGRTIFFLSVQDFVAEYGYTGTFTSTVDAHAELASIWNFAILAARLTFRYNVFTHSEGTGGLIMKGDTLDVYGNVFFRPAGDIWSNPNGVIGTWTVDTLTNAKVYNNAFVDISTGPIFGTSFTSPTTGNEVRNNLFYNVTGNLGGLGSLFPTYSHNHYVDSSSPISETGKTTGTGDPFVNYPALDFRLKAATAAGMALASPWDRDMLGNTRGSDGTWDRGAMESGGTTTAGPSAPTNLVVQ